MNRAFFRTLAVTLPIVLGLGASSSRADLIIEVMPASAAVGSSGSFDVLLANTNVPGGTTYDVSADTIDFALTGVSGVTITGATIATITPYIFQTSGTTQGGGPFVTDSTSTSFEASDSEFGSPYFDEIGPGQVFGLAHVSYVVSGSAVAGSMGMMSLAGSNLSDENFDAIPASISGASFTITAAVPAPPALILCSTGLATVGLSRLRRRTEA